MLSAKKGKALLNGEARPNASISSTLPLKEILDFKVRTKILETRLHPSQSKADPTTCFYKRPCYFYKHSVLHRKLLECTLVSVGAGTVISSMYMVRGCFFL